MGSGMSKSGLPMDKSMPSGSAQAMSKIFRIPDGRISLTRDESFFSLDKKVSLLIAMALPIEIDYYLLI